MALYIYYWFDRRHNAIKLGAGGHPGERMLNYAVTCNLDPLPGSLRMHRLHRRADWDDALVIEKGCHSDLRERGLVTVRGLRELFYIPCGDNYDAVAETIFWCAQLREANLLRTKKAELNDDLDDYPGAEAEDHDPVAEQLRVLWESSQPARDEDGAPLDDDDNGPRLSDE